MPPLLLELWREQHPEGHEQVQLDFTNKKAAAEASSIDPGRERSGLLTEVGHLAHRGRAEPHQSACLRHYPGPDHQRQVPLLTLRFAPRQTRTFARMRLSAQLCVLFYRAGLRLVPKLSGHKAVSAGCTNVELRDARFSRSRFDLRT